MRTYHTQEECDISSQLTGEISRKLHTLDPVSRVQAARGVAQWTNDWADEQEALNEEIGVPERPGDRCTE